MEATEYPPESSHTLINDTTKVVMVVDVVSPTPFALLRRAKNFEYRDDDYVLQQFSNYDDPIQALTDECRRVLKCISSTNQSAVSNSKTSTSLVDPSWSRFEDIGFSSTIEESDEDEGPLPRRNRGSGGLAASPRSHNAEFGRPTTPSWADFLSSGFVDENGNKTSTPLLLPPDKILPPIKTTARGHSSQSHRRPVENENILEPGELASIDRLNLDDSFWWVWISSLAGEEPTSRKATFGRCALIETVVAGGRWMIMEEQVKGAAPEPAKGAYIAEKKGFFSTAKGRLTRRRSAVKKSPLSPEPYQKNGLDPTSRVTILPDQHAKIQAAAAELSRKRRLENVQEQERNAGRTEPGAEQYKSNRTSMMSLQPLIMTEASPAMKWATQYDKQVIRAQYLGDALAGTGDGKMLTLPPNGVHANGSVSTLASTRKERDLPLLPKDQPVAREPLPLVVPEPDRFVRDPSPVPEKPATHRASSLPVLTPPRLPVEPAEEVQTREAEQAAEVTLPEPTPTYEQRVVEPPGEQVAPVRPSTPPRPHSRLRKKSLDVPPEQRKPKKKGPTKGPPPVKQPPAGFRQFFGTRRNKSKERDVEPPPLSPAHPNPAIAAARAALEGRKPAPDVNAEQPDSLEHLSKMRMTNPSAASRAVPQRPMTPPESVRGESVTAPIHHEEPKIVHEGPKTRRDEEYDNLSRVDTNERKHADQEFSTFDQGPLLEQPAFAPQDSYAPTPSPQPEAFFTPREEEPSQTQPFSDSRAVIAQQPIVHQTEHDQAANEEPGELTKEVSPMDRWAQIRKNAAERAARQAEEQQGRPSHTETRTDDGETSGEESEFVEVPIFVFVLTALQRLSLA
jgi:hypothetical protein